MYIVHNRELLLDIHGIIYSLIVYGILGVLFGHAWYYKSHSIWLCCVFNGICHCMDLITQVVLVGLYMVRPIDCLVA